MLDLTTKSISRELLPHKEAQKRKVRSNSERGEETGQDKKQPVTLLDEGLNWQRLAECQEHEGRSLARHQL
jgi:hypothetical protein